MDTPVSMTVASLIEGLEAAVEKRGAEYYYPLDIPGWVLGTDGCRYVVMESVKREGRWYGTGELLGPGCILGEVFHTAGISLETLAGYEGEGAEGLIPDLIDERILSVPDHERDLFIQLSKIAQSAQDAEESWGSALNDVKQTYQRLT